VAKRILLSKIIRYVTESPPVFIGERHEETATELRAEATLREFFPVVSFVTAADGARLIPISEVVKFKSILDESCESARHDGFEKGHTGGLEEGLADARNVMSQFEQAVKDALGQRESLLQEAKQNILQLVLKVAKKVTFDAVNVDREAAATMISGVIDQLTDRSQLKIKVNPDFLPIVEQQIDRLLSGSTSIKELKLQADPRVQCGGCFIETPSGDIDARLESQFEVIETVLSDEGEP